MKNFVGDKVKMKKVLDRQIKVFAYKVAPSVLKDGTGEYMQMQIELEGIKYVVNSGSKYLLDTIKKIPKDGFPFDTTIIEVNESHIFT